MLRLKEGLLPHIVGLRENEAHRAKERGVIEMGTKKGQVRKTARRAYKHTRPIKKENDFGWWSFWVTSKQGSYKMSYQGRKQARTERAKMEDLLKIRMK